MKQRMNERMNRKASSESSRAAERPNVIVDRMVAEIRFLGLSPKSSDWRHLGKLPYFSELFPHHKMEVMKIYIPQDYFRDYMIKVECIL